MQGSTWTDPGLGVRGIGGRPTRTSVRPVRTWLVWWDVCYVEGVGEDIKFPRNQ
ncbi:MAG: hypothetical protein H9W81_15805 [Enterococcus sp.]|nr:hypothetical protein [Enterococcus sp.]